MLKKKLQFVPLLLFSIGIGIVNAQNAVLSSGGNAAGSGGSASYSIGQLDYTAITHPSGSVYLGVQQPHATNILPVTLLNLKATKQENKVLVKWETATEINSSKFIVQRSRDGVAFSGFSELAAAGNSNILKKYSIEDLQPLPGRNFYRIKQVDRDGRAVYSKVVSVDFSRGENIAVIYPNPTKQNILLKVTNSASTLLRYELYDVKGDLILSNKIINNETNIGTGNLSSGNYYLKVIGNNKEIKTFKIIKTN